MDWCSRLGPIPNDLTDTAAVKFTAKQTFGTAGISLPWKVVNEWDGTAIAASLATQAKTDVNAEVLDVLNTDTFAEPGQEAPGATVSLAKKIGYLYKAWRNRTTQTSTTYSLYADNTTTVDQKSTVSDNGTTFDRGEIASGP
jgi:hypothetical protein